MLTVSHKLTFYRAHGNDFPELYHEIVNKNDAGVDIYIPNDIVIPARSQVRIPLGVHCSSSKTTSISIPNICNTNTIEPASFFLLPRSSISKTPLRVSNSIGLIDAGYRGELQAPVDNISDKDYRIERGTRLFQIVNSSLAPFDLIKISDVIDETDRGSGGFGSTG